ncbi:hypothetical protein CGCF415_v002114 [Colletotrichum fructicola]|nr:uncharacterized protein CGMCC3_g7375 [Colletotrichum fructicola]KAE9576635.1 hypothetical protein CGMCC3_g7375 [Colletotrichum fructicola]KAF4903699.1 hypothetical protein CGCFRS4_v001457 [Colletotrichum fructicola]KAF4914799.1 hypothetical protein CGCF415_v002114 [Colletotrichum fructicola]KAF4941366.1 hypothetical protein CGCF245_v001897 [Colletotrichum fructicola]
MVHFPDEVWTLIFGQLEFDTRGPDYTDDNEPGSEGLAALSRLCRTSSRFLRLARPFLYRSLPLCNWRLHERLLRTLHQNPHLARSVENVTLGEGVFSRDDITPLLLPYYSEASAQSGARSAAIDAALRVVADGEEWQEGVPDLWFAHCATILPNLKSIEYATRSFDTLFPEIITRAANQGVNGPVVEGQGPDTIVQETPSASHTQQDTNSSALEQSSLPLSKLEEFRIRNQDTELAVRLVNYQDLFLLPKLQTFRGWAVELNTRLASSAQTPRRLSSLRYAHFIDSLADADGICDLLRTCPLLQTLEITWGSSTVGDSTLDFDHIGRVLREHGTGLVELDLDCLECFSFEEAEWSGKIGDLRGLQHLKHLSVPEPIMLGKADDLLPSQSNVDDSDEEEETANENPISEDSLESLLPESLETLRFYSVYDENDWVRKSVQGVLSSQRLKQLKEVQLDDCWRFNVKWDKTGWRSKKLKDTGKLIFYK